MDEAEAPGGTRELRGAGELVEDRQTDSTHACLEISRVLARRQHPHLGNPHMDHSLLLSLLGKPRSDSC